MTALLPDLSVVISGVTCGIASIAAAAVVAKLCASPKLDGIPTVGSSSWLGSWWAAWTYLANAPNVIQEGYAMHKPAPFKVAELHGWTVILTSPEHVEEVRKASEDTFSFTAAEHDLTQFEYICGAEFIHNSKHIPIIRSHLTRNIGVLYPQVKDEITIAFEDVLDLRGNEWKSVPALSSIQRVVGRVSHRIFVGLPLCRNPDWINLNLQFSLDLGKAGAIVRLFPNWLKPIAVWLFTNVEQNFCSGRKFVGPIIEERLRSIKDHGNEWADKPNDFLSWLMEEAEGAELTVERLTARVMLINFAAVHTSSDTFARALLFLAANLQYIQPLREEVETIVKKEGWSKAALNKMWKVDSFLRECQRLEGIASLSVMRKAMKDYTFSDGTFVPKGTTVFAAARCIQHDEAFYENASTFQPFRFSDLREADGESVKYQFVSTATEYLPFGHGRHACPGRFFVASELKSMLAHIVTTYDVMLADDVPPPCSMHVANAEQPDLRAKVMFRKRID